MLSITEARSVALREITDCLGKVCAESMQIALSQISGARRVFLAGAGRSALGIRGFAMRLMHLGKEAHVVGEITTPPIAPGDLLIIGSGSGRTRSLLTTATKAKEIGAKVLLFTIDAKSPIAQLADGAVVIPAFSPKVEGASAPDRSIQPMGSLFEQCLFILLDIIILLLMDKEKVGAEEMFARHANLE